MVKLFSLKRSTKSLASHLLLPIEKRVMSKTKSQRNKYCREWRKKSYEEKRYNKPLREFLELKYRDIFNEYNWFYKSLDQQYPSSKDLTKTPAFKNWKSRQLNCESSDDEPTEAESNMLSAEQIQPESVEAESNMLSAEQIQPEPVEAERNVLSAEQNQSEPVEAESNMLSAAAEGLFPPDNVDVNDLDIDQIDNIIQQVINEMETDEAVRRVLNDDEIVHPQYEDQDEGIVLNVQSELDAIIEPFDYSEVEGFDF